MRRGRCPGFHPSKEVFEGSFWSWRLRGTKRVSIPLRKFLREAQRPYGSFGFIVSIPLRKFLRQVQDPAPGGHRTGFHPSKEVFEVRGMLETVGKELGFHPSKEVFEENYPQGYPQNLWSFHPSKEVFEACWSR